MGSGCAWPLLWRTFKFISVQETAARTMGSLLIHFFSYAGKHNAISFKSSITRGSLLPLWRTGDCSVCTCTCVCISDCSFSGIEAPLPCLCTPTQCKNLSSLRSASSVIKMVSNPLIFFLRLTSRWEEIVTFRIDSPGTWKGDQDLCGCADALTVCRLRAGNHVGRNHVFFNKVSSTL